MEQTVSAVKIDRYAQAIAVELAKAAKRGPRSRKWWLDALEMSIRRELDALDAGKEPYAA